jgi:NAD(P)-dependent dehydrogenase (short-subunit alcohol dehydrogenase family)
MIHFDQKVALITGAAQGIGRGIAEAFAEAGASVALFDLNGAGVREVAGRISTQGKALAITGDVAREEDVRAACEQVSGHFGSLDIVVNNAGIETGGNAVNMASADWDRLMAVNLRGAFLFAKHSIPFMRGKGGAIVNISSVHAFVSYPEDVAYDASKAGLIGLTRALALDHGKDGVRVNAICPGYIETPLHQKWLDALPNPAETMEEVLKFHPVGRIGTPRDVAQAALFLASDAASFITGTYLVVDGGMTVGGH